MLGISFKAGTDDLRESPVVELVEHLLSEGCQIRIYDRNVSLARLCGANKEYIERKIPDVAELLVDEIDEVLRFAATIVVGNNASEFRGALDRLQPDQHVVDLVRLVPEVQTEAAYSGFLW